MDMDLLPTLIAVAEAGGLTAAGRRLGLSQPAVHQQLARLSDQVGHALYERRGRGLVLTRAGQRLVALGRTVARARDDALAELQGEDGAPPVVCAGRGVWRDLVGRLPRCVPMVADGAGTIQAVADGTATLGIAAVPAPEGLCARIVCRVGEVLIVPPDHALVGAQPVAWAALRDAAWVLPPPDRPLRQAIEARAGPCRVAVEVSGWDLQQRFVALGAGVTVINDSVAPRADVHVVPLRDPGVVAYRALWRRGASVEGLIEALGLPPLSVGVTIG